MKKVINYTVLFFIFSFFYIAVFVMAYKSDEVAAQELPQSKELVSVLTVKEPSYLVTCEVKEKTTYLGMYTLTAYCSCELCCGEYAKNRPVDENGQEIVIGSTGAVLKAGHSIAVDPDVIPYGSIIVINGKEYVAEDCGGAIKENRIDVYFNDHNEALQFGIQKADVFIKEVY